MKVTAIVGNPRRKGQSARLVEEIVEGAKENGAEIVVYYLGEKSIKRARVRKPRNALSRMMI
jgi:multimeric flavodoxin WrbA